MKEGTAWKDQEIGAVSRSRMEASIVDTMRRYFRDDKGKMGELELSIVDSVKRYFEGAEAKGPVRR